MRSIVLLSCLSSFQFFLCYFALFFFFFFFSSRRRHTRFDCDWSSDVCSSDLTGPFCVLLIISFGYRFAVSTLTRYTTEGGKQRGRTVIGNDSFIGVDPAINSSSFRNGDQRAVGAILTH